MGIEVYLALVEDPPLWETTESVLVLYLREHEQPPERLFDPAIVGIGPAAGVWDLLLWHDSTRRAFYAENRSASSGEAAL